jgi:hypothetical protein
MQNNQTNNAQLLERNRAVRSAYLQIYKEVKALLSTLEEELLRQIMEREHKGIASVGSIIHELISPLLYLRLECYTGNILAIHYGYDQGDLASQFYSITSAFIRTLYKLTMATDSAINIEDCIRTDWVIVNCSEMFEYMAERNKHHSYKVLKYKPKASNRKLQLQVA